MTESLLIAAVAALAADTTRHLPFELSNNHVYVRVTVGARPLWFLLDTGSPNSLLDLVTAEALGVQLGERFQAGGAGAGTIPGAYVQNATARLTDAPGVTIPIAAAIALPHIAAHEGRAVDGILGYDFISQFVLAIDYQARRLRLYEPQAFRYAGSGARIPLTLVGNYPHVRAELVLADGGRVAADFVVDVGSGLALALTSPLVAAHRLRERVGATVRVPGTRGIGGDVTVAVGRVAALRLGSLEIARPVASLFGDSAGVFSTTEHFEGNIGGDVLRRFTAYFDYGRGELILEPNAAHATPFESDMSGAQLTTDGDFTRIQVTHVAPGSPADTAGLMAGDTVTAVAGLPAVAGSLGDLRQRLHQEGTPVELTLRRGGATRTVTVVPRRRV